MFISIEQTFGEEVTQLIAAHLTSASVESPPESVHALPLTELQQDNVTFWCAWEQCPSDAPPDRPAHAPAPGQSIPDSCVPEGLMGFAALKELTAQHAELKSMRTNKAFLRRGVATALLQEILKAARQRGFSRISLETGSMLSYQPAVELYKGFGFTSCGPFGDYKDDPNSLYLTCALS